MQTLVLATRNAGKQHEFDDLLRGAGILLRPLGDFPDAEDPAETGDTFEENALIKARAAAEASGQWALADDSGLCVDALGGRPGVRSARYADGSDEARWQKLLGELADVPEAARTARFTCVLAVASPGGQTHTVSRSCEGRIALAPRGEHGFGYDPVFVVAEDPAGRTMAELSTAEKRAVGHRGKAFEALRPHLARLLRGA
jgi:XTP/dITP diphosphohydrolase